MGLAGKGLRDGWSKMMSKFVPPDPHDLLHAERDVVWVRPRLLVVELLEAVEEPLVFILGLLADRGPEPLHVGLAVVGEAGGLDYARVQHAGVNTLALQRVSGGGVIDG